MQKFNVKTYHQVEDLLGEERTQELRHKFVCDAKERFHDIKTRTLRSEEVRRHLHSLISVSGYLGFEEFSQTCRDTVDCKEGITDGKLKHIYRLFDDICSEHKN